VARARHRRLSERDWTAPRVGMLTWDALVFVSRVWFIFYR